jgi:4-aminobutyrate---pyruvate transaminase
VENTAMTLARDLQPANQSAFLHSFSDLAALERSGPCVIERGEGIYVFDRSGRRYMEGNSGLWNVVLGYDNGRLKDAVRRQLDRLPAYHGFFGRLPDVTLELAERLRAIAPMRTDKVFFTNSGSEANDTAAKMLWMVAQAEGHPGRRKFISRMNAYHGVTVMTANLTGKAYNKAFGLPTGDVEFAECPHFWRNGRPGESEAEFNRRMARDLETLIQREGADTIAGFFAEPVMGAGGVIVPPQGYFQAIQPVLKNYGIPLVADEVICGFGRTGKLWGSQVFGIEPDILVASKCITAGYFPMGAVLLSPEMSNRLEDASKLVGEFPHGFTTGAHPVGAAVALEAIDILVGDDYPGRVSRMAPQLQDGLKRLEAHAIVGEARGIGFMGALEIVADKQTKVPFPAEQDVSERIAAVALDKGLIIRPLGNAVIIAPPFIITEDEIEEMLAIITETLDTVGAVVKDRQ